MYPVICRIGPFTLFSYGLMLFTAYVVCLALALYRTKRLPEGCVAVPAEALGDLTAVGLLGGVLGGRLYYVLLNWEWMRGDWFEIIAIWHGGLVWYGGLLGGILAAWVYVRRKKISFLAAADQLIPFVALGHAIGRLGCFLNGCCYGKPTEHALGVTFPGFPVAVWPTQLFESFGLFLVFGLLWFLQTPDRLRRRGSVLSLYILFYAALRFCVEFFRGDLAPVAFSLTLAQWISIVLFAAGGWLYVRSKR